MSDDDGRSLWRGMATVGGHLLADWSVPIKKETQKKRGPPQDKKWTGQSAQQLTKVVNKTSMSACLVITFSWKKVAD